MRITLLNGPFFTFILQSEEGRTRLVQHDTDFPLVAQAFGWSGGDEISAQEIWDAYAFLDEHVGATADDPGYF